MNRRTLFATLAASFFAPGLDLAVASAKDYKEEFTRFLKHHIGEETEVIFDKDTTSDYEVCVVHVHRDGKRAGGLMFEMKDHGDKTVLDIGGQVLMQYERFKQRKGWV